MKRLLSTALLTTGLLAGAGFSLNATAESATYEFDVPHSQMIFFVDHIGFSTSEGQFEDISGSFTFDPDNVTAATVDLTIQTASIDMGYQKWDDHMKNADFFDVEKYPTMTFKSTKVESADGKTGTVTGDLTILDVTKPITLDVTFNKAGIHPFNKKFVAGFSAKGSLKRSDFGMKYGLPMIGDDVELRIEIEGIRQ